jgi:hypothetical protein
MNNTDYQLQKTDAIAKIINGNPFLKFPAFNNDLDVALVASKYDSSTLRHIGPDLIENKELIISALNYFPISAQFIDKSLFQDADIMIATLKRNSYFIKNNFDHLFENINFTFECLKKYPQTFNYLPSDIKKNRDICIFILKNEPILFKEVDSSLKNDHDFFLLLTISNPTLLSQASPNIQNDRLFLNRLKNYHNKQFKNIILFDKNYQLWYETKMNILMNYEEESRLQCIMNNSHKMRKATLKF